MRYLLLPAVLLVASCANTPQERAQISQALRALGDGMSGVAASQGAAANAYGGAAQRTLVCTPSVIPGRVDCR